MKNQELIKELENYISYVDGYKEVEKTFKTLTNKELLNCFEDIEVNYGEGKLTNAGLENMLKEEILRRMKEPKPKKERVKKYNMKPKRKFTDAKRVKRVKK